MIHRRASRLADIPPVRALNDRVIEKTVVFSREGGNFEMLSGSGEELYIREYGSHDITKGMRGINTVLYLPRVVVPVPAAEMDPNVHTHEAQIGVLAASSENGWVETDPEQDPPRFDPNVDIAGPIPVAVAIERGAVMHLDLELRPARIVVVGDSDFVANGRMSGGNEDLFMNSMNWFLERRSLMAVGSRAYGPMYLSMDDHQRLWLFLIVVAAMPAGCALLGFAVWFKRSR